MAERGTNEDGICSKCSKPGHKATDCKATWKKAWPGRPVMKIGLRYPDGSWMEMVSDLTPETWEKAQALLAETIRTMKEER